jgi:hypothetical protein
VPDSTIAFVPVGQRGMRVTLRTKRGWELVAEGALDLREPRCTGAERLASNRVINLNLWAYACAEKERRVKKHPATRLELEKQAARHAEVVRNVADLVDKLNGERRTNWCSACFEHTDHGRVESGGMSTPTYLCRGCGAATSPCVAPRCSNMATRGFGSVRIPRYCAEHRHDLPSFEHGGDRIEDLADYPRLLKFRKPNLGLATKTVGTAAVLAGAMSGVGLMAAPLIGGFIGTTVGGYTGAAASSYGLALLGGGSLAAGGLGMAGGTAVVAAVGSALGGVMGASLTSAYVGEDKSFAIEKLKDGVGVAVVVCSGFLTEGKGGWGDWERIVTEKYPDSPVYRVHWGSRELNDLAFLLGANTGKFVVSTFVKKAAAVASKSAAKIASPITGALIVVDLAKNPWWRARERANKTGAVMADLIGRTDMDEVVLVGHSLGARAMMCTVEALSTKPSAPAVREVHLLGAARDAVGDWTLLATGVRKRVYNYHSKRDKVLRFFYATVEGGDVAAGFAGISSKRPTIENIDVTGAVGGHSDYCTSLSLK